MPIKLLPTVEGPLAGKTENEVNFVVMRENKIRTHDLNENNSTSEMGDAIIDKLIEIHD